MNDYQHSDSFDNLFELYQEVIIDHSQHPHHFGALPQATHHAEGVNPLCGDTLTLYLKIENAVIRDAAFQGHGCAISTASASLLTDSIIGKSIDEAKRLFEAFHQLITSEKETAADNMLGKLIILAGVKNYPARVKCATLAWHTLQAALRQDAQPVTTEA
ncbi:MAG: system FeS assembly protein NifU family [Gammaproteobacteria bacterium]|jgi:nitrogen fixation NifU-like protein|nr:system FeS assembly protein NifU family [Gammaproteobacteria bacterium]